MELSQEEKVLIRETKEWLLQNARVIQQYSFPIEYVYFKRVDIFFERLLVAGFNNDMQKQLLALQMYTYDILKLDLPSSAIWEEVISYLQNIFDYLSARNYERNYETISPSIKEVLQNSACTVSTHKKVEKLFVQYQKVIKKVPNSRMMIDNEIRKLLIALDQDFVLERELKKEIARIEQLLYDLLDAKSKSYQDRTTIEEAITLDFKQNGIWRKEDAFQVKPTEDGYELIIYIIDVTKGEHGALLHYRNLEEKKFLKLLYDDFLEKHHCSESTFQEGNAYSAVAHKFYFDKQFQLKKKVPEIYLTNVLVKQNLYEEKLKSAEKTGKWGDILKDSYDTITLSKQLMKNVPTTIKYCKKGKLSQKLSLFLNITMTEYFYNRNIPYLKTSGVIEEYGTFSCPKKNFMSYFNQLMEKKYLYYKNMDYNMIQKDIALMDYIEAHTEDFQVGKKKSEKRRKKEIK
ncbi:MAG: hypothetical protein KH135_05735 [Firmicutes bacterium]|nr:hypothetical protein [Bacillota bacterium]